KDIVRKIRCVSMVNSLTKGWQQWAQENTSKQSNEPTGWTPGCEDGDDGDNGERCSFTRKLPVDAENAAKKEFTMPTLKNLRPDFVPDANTSIRTGARERGNARGVKEQRKEMTSMLKSRFEPSAEENQGKQPPSAVDDKLYLLSDRMSPTLRRRCNGLVSELSTGWRQAEKEDGDGGLSSLEAGRSSSIDAGDVLAVARGEGSAGEAVEATNHGGGSGGSEAPAIGIKRSSARPGADRATDVRAKGGRQKSRCSRVKDLQSGWAKWSEDHMETQKLNPFSDGFDAEHALATRPQKGEEGYGRPKEGTLTAERAKRAERHIRREMEDMCFIINGMGVQGRDGRVRMPFGELFDRYVRISDKVVGILLRARKHGMVDFEGEMLWQGRDDHVVITLLR
uniref:Actin-binding Rho-activating protein n=1 Tax=Petromyzon marinus TaxID=7757 RepID=S4S0Q0_PETMA